MRVHGPVNGVRPIADSSTAEPSTPSSTAGTLPTVPDKEADPETRSGFVKAAIASGGTHEAKSNGAQVVGIRVKQKSAKSEEQFPSVAEWNRALAARTPKRLRQALFDLAQAFPYLGAEDRSALTPRVLGLAAERDPRLASTWVEGAFRVGGPEVLEALRRHADGSRGSPESRQLAGARASEMEVERLTRTVLLAASPGDRSRPAPPVTLPLDPAFGDRVGDKAEITMTPTEVARALGRLGIEEKRDALTASGYAPALATDCDGTTWKHDIGEALFARAVERRMFRPEAQEKLARLLEKYGLEPTPDVNDNARSLVEAWESGELEKRGVARGMTSSEVTLDYYAANVWCFAGHTVAAMKAHARELFEEPNGFKGKIFDRLHEVLAHAREGGLIPYAISASNQWIVEVGAEYLGIPPWRVAGIRAEVKDGRITTEILRPITYGPGKVEAIAELTGGKPVVAAGDSVDSTDREMLESALLRLAVEPKSSRHEFVMARAHDNWRFVDYRGTRDGERADNV